MIPLWQFLTGDCIWGVSIIQPLNQAWRLCITTSNIECPTHQCAKLVGVELYFVWNLFGDALAESLENMLVRSLRLKEEVVNWTYQKIILHQFVTIGFWEWNTIWDLGAWRRRTEMSISYGWISIWVFICRFCQPLPRDRTRRNLQAFGYHPSKPWINFKVASLAVGLLQSPPPPLGAGLGVGTGAGAASFVQHWISVGPGQNPGVLVPSQPPVGWQSPFVPLTVQEPYVQHFLQSVIQPKEAEVFLNYLDINSTRTMICLWNPTRTLARTCWYAYAFLFAVYLAICRTWSCQTGREQNEESNEGGRRESDHLDNTFDFVESNSWLDLLFPQAPPSRSLYPSPLSHGKFSARITSLHEEVD